jgi:hypothetical protein
VHQLRSAQETQRLRNALCRARTAHQLQELHSPEVANVIVGRHTSGLFQSVYLTTCMVVSCPPQPQLIVSPVCKQSHIPEHESTLKLQYFRPEGQQPTGHTPPFPRQCKCTSENTAGSQSTATLNGPHPEPWLRLQRSCKVRPCARRVLLLSFSVATVGPYWPAHVRPQGLHKLDHL